MDRRTFITLVGSLVPTAAYAQFSGGGNGFRTGGGGTGGGGGGGGGTAPVNSVVPAISGTRAVGSTLTATTGTWSGSPTPTYAYQWKRNGTNIGSATASTYLLVTADGGMTITVTVTATNSAGSANATSTGVGIQPPGVTGLIGWWDLSISSGITLSGSNVTAVADQSGNGNNLANGGLGRTLPYSATGFNTSYPAIVATGGNGFLESPTANFPMGTGNTLTAWFVGTMMTGSSNGTGRFMSYTHGGVNDFNNAGSWGAYAATTTQTQLFRNNVFASATGISASPAGHRIIYTIDSSGGMTVYVDGVSVATATSSGNWISNGVVDLFRQAQHDIDFGYFTFAEGGVATDFSNAASVALLDTYLKNKWGL